MSTDDIRDRIIILEQKSIASEKALDLAWEALRVWQIGSNEVRKQILEERIMFCTNVKSDAMLERIIVLEKIIELNKGRQSGSDKVWATVIVILGLIFGLVELLLRWPR